MGQKYKSPMFLDRCKCDQSLDSGIFGIRTSELSSLFTEFVKKIGITIFADLEEARLTALHRGVAPVIYNIAKARAFDPAKQLAHTGMATVVFFKNVL